jgi:PKD repeat protein
MLPSRFVRVGSACCTSLWLLAALPLAAAAQPDPAAAGQEPAVPALPAVIAMVAEPGAVAEGTSAAQNPLVTFTSVGPHTVTLTACNALGCTMSTQTVTVLDPTPAITQVTASPTLAVVGGAGITLSALATGQPPLTYTWAVQLAGITIATLSGPSAVWGTFGIGSGLYSIQLTVSNGSGSVSQSVPVTLTPRPARFNTVTPCRVLDTRTGQVPLVAGAAARVIPVANSCGVPATATAVAINLTVVGPTTAGSVTVYPADAAQSQLGTIAFLSGQTRAVGTVTTLSFDSLGQLAAVVSAGQTDLLVDVNGYFAP